MNDYLNLIFRVNSLNPNKIRNALTKIQLFLRKNILTKTEANLMKFQNLIIPENYTLLNLSNLKVKTVMSSVIKI